MRERARAVKERSTHDLFNKFGVTGVGNGKKIVNGIPTTNDAILVFVKEKIDPDAITTQGADPSLIPKEIDGVPVDVIEVGDIQLQRVFQSKVRPIKPGFSISHGNVSAGTIGGLFYDKDGDVVALSNSHVLANAGLGRLGDVIYQPGTIDARDDLKFIGWDKPYDRYPYIGTLKSFSPLGTTGGYYHDSAIAKIYPELVDGGYIDTAYPELNHSLDGFCDVSVGDTVYKCGRTTGFTTSKIIAENAEFRINYSFGQCTFKNVTLASAMSEGGDSGSIGLNKDLKAFGLLFAGSEKVTLFNPIGPIVEYYGLRPIVDEHSPLPKPLWSGRSWNTATTDGSIEFVNNEIIITDNANHHCYIESNTPSQNGYFSTTINTGSDKGATWGIGMALVFPSSVIRLNLRYSGAYGAYINESANISIGATKPNSNYNLIIQRNATHWVGSIENEEKQRVVILEIPIKLVGRYPSCVRIGKMGDNGGPKDFSAPNTINAGEIGFCKILNFQMV